MSEFKFPPIKFCPSCGRSDKLADEHWHVGGISGLVEGHECSCPEAEEIGSKNTWCRGCGAHFGVSGSY